MGRHKSGRESRGTRVEGFGRRRSRETRVEWRGSRVEGRGRGVEGRATRVEGICILGAGLWSLDARHSLRPIIHLPDLQIRILLPLHLMPPAIHIMRERTSAHLPETVELGDIFNANNGVGHGGRVEWRGARVEGFGRRRSRETRVEGRGLDEESGVERPESRVEGWMKKGESRVDRSFRRWSLVSGRSTPLGLKRSGAW